MAVDAIIRIRDAALMARYLAALACLAGVAAQKQVWSLIPNMTLHVPMQRLYDVSKLTLSIGTQLMVVQPDQSRCTVWHNTGPNGIIFANATQRCGSRDPCSSPMVDGSLASNNNILHPPTWTLNGWFDAAHPGNCTYLNSSLIQFAVYGATCGTGDWKQRSLDPPGPAALGRRTGFFTRWVKDGPGTVLLGGTDAVTGKPRFDVWSSCLASDCTVPDSWYRVQDLPDGCSGVSPFTIDNYLYIVCTLDGSAENPAMTVYMLFVPRMSWVPFTTWTGVAAFTAPLAQTQFEWLQITYPTEDVGQPRFGAPAASTSSVYSDVAEVVMDIDASDNEPWKRLDEYRHRAVLRAAQQRPFSDDEYAAGAPSIHRGVNQPMPLSTQGGCLVAINGGPGYQSSNVSVTYDGAVWKQFTPPFVSRTRAGFTRWASARLAVMGGWTTGGDTPGQPRQYAEDGWAATADLCCATSCDAQDCVICNGHGTCLNDGATLCQCDAGYGGNYCDPIVTPSWTPSPVPNATSSPQPSPNNGNGKKGSVAGAVMGSLLGIGALAAVGLFFYRRSAAFSAGPLRGDWFSTFWASVAAAASRLPPWLGGASRYRRGGAAGSPDKGISDAYAYAYSGQGGPDDDLLSQSRASLLDNAMEGSGHHADLLAGYMG